MRSPALTSSGTSLPDSSRAPGPTATISPSWGFSLAVSGMMMPPAVFSSDSTRRTTTRSWRGRNFMGLSLPLQGVATRLPDRVLEHGVLALDGWECYQRGDLRNALALVKTLEARH